MTSEGASAAKHLMFAFTVNLLSTQWLTLKIFESSKRLSTVHEAEMDVLVRACEVWAPGPLLPLEDL